MQRSDYFSAAETASCFVPRSGDVGPKHGSGFWTTTHDFQSLDRKNDPNWPQLTITSCPFSPPYLPDRVHRIGQSMWEYILREPWVLVFWWKFQHWTQALQAPLCVLGCQLAWARAAASRLPPGNAPLGRDWWQLRELFGDVMTVGSLGSTGYSGLSANFMAIFQQSDIREILNHREWIIIKPSKNEVLLLLGFYAARASPSFTISRSVRKPTVPGHFDLAEDFKIPPGRSAASYLGISAINPSDRLSW